VNMSPDERGSIPLETVVPELFGNDDFNPIKVLEVLTSTAESTCISVGMLTDEELVILDGRTDQAADDFDEPRLSRLSEQERQISVEAVLHVLIARGEVAVLEPDSLIPTGRAAFLAEIRGAAPAVARIEFGARTSDEVSRWAAYFLGNDTVLLEEVFDAGIHSFSVMASAKIAQHLLSQIGLAGSQQADLEPRYGNQLEELGVAEIVDAAEASGFIAISKLEEGTSQESLFSVYNVDDRLVVLQGWSKESDGAVVVNFLGSESAHKWVTWLLGDGFRLHHR
jgi:hypothetical protein